MLRRYRRAAVGAPGPAQEGIAMGRTYDQLDERLRRWIAGQRMFFVATAPSGPGGHVNLSPKGHADVEELDAVGPWEVLAHWTQHVPQDGWAVSPRRASAPGSTWRRTSLPPWPAPTGPARSSAASNTTRNPRSEKIPARSFEGDGTDGSFAAVGLGSCWPRSASRSLAGHAAGHRSRGPSPQDQHAGRGGLSQPGPGLGADYPWLICWLGPSLRGGWRA
jgi:hypothetical protein